MREIPNPHIINAAAGSHPITAEPRELDAALRAADRSLREFPYYRARYGERARDFGHSDGAWTALLARDTQRGADEQVLWLGRVLASRGMPTLLLERHLRVLHDELAAAVPEEAARYETLLRSADLLAARRRRVVGDGEMRRLGAAFALAVGDAWNARLPRAGEIIAAAVADEQLGIGGAAVSVRRWMADPERFPPQWIDAVHRAFAAARDLMPVPAATP